MITASRVHGHTITYTCLACKAARRFPAPPILDLDTPAADDTKLTMSTTSTPAASEAPAPLGKDKAGTMEVDAPATAVVEPKKKHRKSLARVPPLFERKGHAIFRGNELLVGS